MALFDSYIPDPSLKCPVCRTTLTDWQGFDGPNSLFVWKQGLAAPVAQLVDDDIAISTEERNTLRLPEKFFIRDSCCSDRFSVEAICKTVSGIWKEASLVTAENAVQRKEETRADFKARVRWLSGNTA